MRWGAKTEKVLAGTSSILSPTPGFSRKAVLRSSPLLSASTCSSTAVAVSIEHAFHPSEYPTDLFTYTALVQKCGLAKALPHGHLLYALIVMDTPFCGNTHLLSLLVQMYGQCIALDDANAVFVHMQEKNVYSWNIMMGVNAKLGMWLKAGLRNVFEAQRLQR
ncbi:hypothetical protein GOP47_0024748 [Adiantum capillus-veneris]|uniref:Pentatricopeptide repeat-containing protein n=1 Tax=Adiantum capillus-veneris TaxID=13818 RepID=A0A9D4U2P1_ADICA|nr:hypothetical protein GOP47_0024748 [Adiantum capillus-veneris]